MQGKRPISTKTVVARRLQITMDAASGSVPFKSTQVRAEAFGKPKFVEFVLKPIDQPSAARHA